MFNFTKSLQTFEDRLHEQIREKERDIQEARKGIMEEECTKQQLTDSLVIQNSKMKEYQQHLQELRFSLPPSFKRTQHKNISPSLIKNDEQSLKRFALLQQIRVESEIALENIKRKLMEEQIAFKREILQEMKTRTQKLKLICTNQNTTAHQKNNENLLRIYWNKKELDFIRGNKQKLLKDLKRMQSQNTQLPQWQDTYHEKIDSIYQRIKELQEEF